LRQPRFSQSLSLAFLSRDTQAKTVGRHQTPLERMLRHILETQLSEGSAEWEPQAWAVSMDNDLFVPGSVRDVDFTGGLALSYSGRAGLEYWKLLDDALGAFDRVTGADHESFAVTPSIEFGMYGFTPHRIEANEVLTDDRPYASLVYLSVSRIYRSEEPGGDAWSSSLTIGALGLDLFGDVQNRAHELTGSKTASGWRHQVSDGGELTFRYQAAYHDYWDSNPETRNFKTTYFASVGYLTEAGIAFSTRQGLISSPSHRFNPELVSYGERVNEAVMTPGEGDESYFWGGISLKARAYNAFLQGQFRRSEHTLDRDELRPVLAEAWAGYTAGVICGLKFSYFLRAQTSEIREGAADRSLIWGGFVISRSLD
jgi:hypothetical protein